MRMTGSSGPAGAIPATVEDMGPETSSARALARLLVGDDAWHDPERALVARVAACERVQRDLARWVGGSGCHALFTRALAQVRAEHPALAHVEARGGPAPGLDRIPEAVRDAGAEATAAALDALLVTLLALLGRLIGEDMVEQLLRPAVAPPSASEAAPTSPDDVSAR